MPRGCKPERERALSNAERQSRYRARQHDQMATPKIRGTACPPIDAAERNAGAMQSMNCSPCNPNTLRGSTRFPTAFAPTGESLQAIADLDLNALAEIDPPRGYGRD